MRVPDVGPGDDEEAAVVRIRVLELVVDLVEAEGLVLEKHSLLLPAGIVVKGLEDDAVNVDSLLLDLGVQLENYVRGGF